MNPNNPQSVETLLSDAIRMHQSGRIDDAAELYTQILVTSPYNADAMHLLGVVHLQKGRYTEAYSLISSALAINPKSARAHNNLGLVHSHQGNADKALSSFRRALQLDPEHAEAYNNIGNAEKQLGHYREAINSYLDALTINPRYAECHYNLGNCYLAFKQYDLALQSYANALEIIPGYAEALNNSGNAHSGLGNFEDARTFYLQAIELRPDYAEAYYNLARLLHQNNQLERAIQRYRQAVELKPEYPEAHNNLGMALISAGKVDIGIEHYRSAIEQSPDYADAHYNLSQALLLKGDFENGWPEYEWRLKKDDATAVDGPRWDGMPLGGRALIITAEQAIGDQVMFASCIPDLIGRTGSSLILECDPRLLPLFKRSFPRILVREQSPLTELMKAFVHIPVGSLPGMFRRSKAEFPEKRRQYLLPDLDKTAVWRERYQALDGKLKIGFSWRGGKDALASKSRSTALADWEPLLRSGHTFVNLQYGDCNDELRQFEKNTGIQIHDWAEVDPLTDLDEFCAQIAALDLVISIDNSTLHLAGALGQNVWALLPTAPESHWLLDRERSIWYPQMRLFRQRQRGQWEGLFRHVAGILAQISVKPPESS